MNSPFFSTETDQATSSLPLARRKFEFLEGTITGPQPPYTQSDWNTVNAMLVSWITNTIDPEVKSTLSKFRDAKRLWEHLKQRYAMVNGPRIQLKTSIAKCEQRNLCLTTYYGKLNVLWEELFKHEPLISCNCCSSCTAASLHHARREQGKLHDFLMGLNTDLYAQLRTNILSQDPLPSLDRAYQLVIQDERVRLAKAVTEDKPTEVLGFVRLNGHETSTCWSSLLVLTLYRSTLHTEQWKALVGLIGNAQVQDGRLNGKFDTKSWIIDTGATHHVTGDLSWLFDTIALFECPVGLPNGESVVATQSGSVRLSNNITLKNVLYVPKLNCNLLSVSQLIDDLHSDWSGVRRDGLYYWWSQGDSIQHVSPINAASTLSCSTKDGTSFERNDFDDFVDDDADLPNPQAQTQNPEASSRLFHLSRKLFPLLGLIHLGLTIQAMGDAPMGKGMRDKFPSVLLRDFVTHTVVAESPSPPFRLHKIPRVLLIP
ncbi:hypothetical protein AAG906_035958 [Vitis piasezkii]